jgi:hypothetical protein
MLAMMMPLVYAAILARGFGMLHIASPRALWRVFAAGANYAKVADFGDKDLLQHIDLARILFSEVIPLRRDAR